MNPPRSSGPATDPPAATNPSPPKPAVPPNPAGAGSSGNEAPDRDTPAWEGSEPDDSVGLVDPRHEIRTPPGL